MAPNFGSAWDHSEMSKINSRSFSSLPQGPAPRRLKGITESMKKTGEFAWQEVLYFGHIQKKPIALRPADPAKFSGTEINLIRQTVEEFWTMSATEISDQSHLFLGWKAARLQETIPYSTALVTCRRPTNVRFVARRDSWPDGNDPFSGVVLCWASQFLGVTPRRVTNSPC